MAAPSLEDPSENPFTDEVLEKILHDEESSSSQEGWKFVKKNNEIEVWQKNDKEKPVQLIKGFLNYKDIPPEVVADIVQDLESRPMWDKLFPIIEVVETYESHKIVYWRSNLPLGISERDVVHKVCTRYDESTNTTFILHHNTTHPSKPPMSGVIRAETLRGEIIIRPHPDLPNSTKLTLFLQTDMKGWIPRIIMNALSSKGPETWHENLTTYYKEHYSKRNK